MNHDPELRVLFCSSEAVPYAKTGGLADVAGALPDALRKQGCDVRLYLPFHRSAKSVVEKPVPLAQWVPIPVGVHRFHAHFWETTSPEEIPVYLLEKDEFFDREHLYGHPTRGDYDDNIDRFVTFCRAVYPLCRHLDWAPHVIHVHDWQTALIPAYLRHHWSGDPFFHATSSVCTIHNLGYQGLFPGSYFSLTGLPPEAYTVDGLEFWGQCNFLKGGIQYARKITTVSPTYGQEIQSAEQGFGLDGVLRWRKGDLHGILNGIDVKTWNPATDPYIPARYDHRDLSPKAVCKARFLEECGLSSQQDEFPLMVMISRIAAQKGFDILRSAFANIMERKVTMVILGTGDRETEKWLREMQQAFGHRFRVFLRFDDALAHRMEAAADLFLMPSRYEPCGLNQMYSLRYGTLPVVHAVGGLEDSVVDVDEDPDQGTGFKFRQYSPEALLAALDRALRLYDHPPAWRQTQLRAMQQDFSWERSARSYVQVYREALGG